MDLEKSFILEVVLTLNPDFFLLFWLAATFHNDNQGTSGSFDKMWWKNLKQGAIKVEE